MTWRQRHKDPEWRREDTMRPCPARRAHGGMR